MTLLDDLAVWLTSGPGAPSFAQLFASAHTVVKEFSTVEGGAPARTFGGLSVRLQADEDLRSPSNGLLRRVPDLSLITDEEKAAFRRDWPPLRGPDGERFGPDGTALQAGDLLLEVWGAAHRRYEYLWVALDLTEPQPTDADRRPQMPVPRWFHVRGVAVTDSDAAAQAVVAHQFSGALSPPTLAGFGKGQAAIYVPCGDKIGRVAASQTVEVRAFDGGGLPVDPAFVFAQFARLATQGFGRLAVPDEAAASAWATAWASALPPRHTIVFSDHRGRPYEPWDDVDSPPQPPNPPVPPPPRTVFIPEVGVEAAIPDHGVLTFGNGSPEHTDLVDEGIVDVAIAGEHTRVGLHPHGVLGASLSAGFLPWSFFRIRVVDYARWFPRNANERNELQRYSEGNHYEFLIDGEDTFRELYRDIRATHRHEEYLRDDDIPDGTPHPAADIAGTQVLAVNAWISAGNPLLGRRAMLATPRMQPGTAPPENLGAALLARPVYDFAGPRPAPPAMRRYCLVLSAGTLGPGTFVELRQLAFSTRFLGDDPYLVGDDFNADIFGRIVAPKDASSWAFAGPDGGCVLLAVHDPDWDGEAVLRAATWEPDADDPAPLDTATSGRGRMRLHAYGTIDLPPAPGGLTPPPLTGIDIGSPARLRWDGTLGLATVLLPAGLVTSVPTTAVVVHQRTGETVSVAVTSTSTDIEIPVLQFARDDTVLLGFTSESPATPGGCAGFFQLRATDGQKADGSAPLHAKEVGGLLREAVQAGVDVRLLAWHDQLSSPDSALDMSPGMVAVVNAEVDGRRGQAMLDRLNREVGVHHQKSTFIRSPAGAVAFLGGIDLKNGRFDKATHPDPDPDRPGDPWHDIHCRLVGRAVWDVYRNLQERWNVARSHPDLLSVPDHATDLAPPSETEILSSPTDGSHAVQVNRTLPPHVEAHEPIVNPAFGDRSVRQSYRRAIAQATRFLYFEDQYLWDPLMAQRIRDRLVAAGGIDWAVVILPRRLSEVPTLDLAFYAMRRRCVNIILNGQAHLPPGQDPSTQPGWVGDRVVIAHLFDDNSHPVYVHTKVVVVDDLWMSIGSANLSRRSMGYDSEITAATIDTRIRRGAHVTPREFRVALMAEHLRLLPQERPLVEHPDDAFALFKTAMSGGRPWAKAGLVAYDPEFTHYGHQPPDFDAHFPDALAAGLDPDGEQPFGIRLADFKGLLQTFADADDPATFGNVTAVRATADVTALPPLDPTDGYRWTVELKGNAPGVLLRAQGPMPATEAADFGIVSSLVPWQVSGHVARESDPGTVVSTSQATVVVTGLVSQVALAFS